jgi:hypothetical protein
MKEGISGRTPKGTACKKGVEKDGMQAYVRCIKQYKNKYGRRIKSVEKQG